jgi:hypothetical protein
VKTLSNGQNTGKKQSGIDRRDFAVPTSFTRPRVEPVIEPAALLVRARFEEAQRIECALSCLRLCDPFPICGDAERRQTKTCGGDTGDILVTGVERFSIHARPIRYKPRIRIGLFPEILKRATLKIVKKRLRRKRRTKKD